MNAADIDQVMTESTPYVDALFAEVEALAVRDQWDVDWDTFRLELWLARMTVFERLRDHLARWPRVH